MVTNNWKWEEFLDGDAGPFLTGLLIVLAISSGIAGSVFLFFYGVFVWWLAIVPVVTLYLIYKALTSADFYFEGTPRSRAVYQQYCDLPKEVRKKVGKVDARLIKHMSATDREVLSKSWAIASEAWYAKNPTVVQSANPKIQSLLDRSQDAAEHFQDGVKKS